MCSCRWLPGLALLDLTIVGGGLVYDYYESRPRFAIDEPDRVFDSLPTGQPHSFTYRIHNMTGNPMRVVGAEYT